MGMSKACRASAQPVAVRRDEAAWRQPTVIGARRAAVIGAGAVGIATGLYLQRDGWQVTVIDPAAPGEQASGGNAGLLALAHVAPVALPGTLRQVPRMLLDPESALRIRWRYLPRLLPWLTRFVQASAPGRVETVSRALADLLRGALEAYVPLLKAARATDLIRRQGYLVALAGEGALAAARPELELRRRRGVRFEILREGEIRQLVPALAKEIDAGIFYPDVSHTVDPQRLVKALAEALARGGGTLRRARALGFETGSDGVSAVVTDAGRVPADLVVVAAGAWSQPLAAALGCTAPLETERGYHVTLPEPGIEPRLPVVSSALRFCATPMAMGLRLAGTVEFAGLAAPPDPARWQVMLKQAKRLYPALNTSGASYWMGHRPSLPDSLPVIGRAPRHANAYLAFGHGHIGLTAAAITGRALADRIAGRPPPFDLAPFRADRF
jgi:D-amino-acid dehydrogenase